MVMKKEKEKIRERKKEKQTKSVRNGPWFGQPWD